MIEDQLPLIEDQPPPQPSQGDLWQLLIDEMRQHTASYNLVANYTIKNMEERRRLGIERYGTPVQPFNGRDALVDAYQESLDLLVYLKQCECEMGESDPTGYDAKSNLYVIQSMIVQAKDICDELGELMIRKENRLRANEGRNSRSTD